MEKPARLPYYAAMATVGSLLGCIWIYGLAKKGGELYFHRHGGRGAHKAKQWVDDHAFWSLFVPAILPPPMQFKIFVLAQGAFQVPLKTFVVALVLGRGFRFLVEGILDGILFFQMRPIRGSFWVLVDGIVTLLLGLMIYRRWPSSSAWAIGTLVGVSMIISGVTRVMLSLAVRKATGALAE